MPQGSVLGPLLYIIYTADIPTHHNTQISRFADDTAIISIDEDLETATNDLQNHITLLENSYKLESNKIKVNVTKYAHIVFTLRDSIVPLTNSIKCLGLRLDNKLTWTGLYPENRNSTDTTRSEYTNV